MKAACAWAHAAVARFRAILFHATLLAFCAAYVFAGALLFRSVEHKHEHALRDELERVLDAEAGRFIGGVDRLLSDGDEPFDFSLNLLIDDYQFAIFDQFENPIKENWFKSSYSNNGTYMELWTMPMALLFTTTSIVPVGFGFVTPLTTLGRCLLVLYSIIGLPLAMITLSDFGKFLCAFLLRCFKKMERTMIAMIVLLVAYPIFGAIFIYFCANLSWTESLYFCIASMFTIGFGDILPSMPLGYLIVFVVAGVLLVTAAVDLLASGIIHNIHYLGRRVFKAKRLARKMFQLAAHQVSVDVGLVGSGLSQLNSFARTNATSLLRIRDRQAPPQNGRIPNAVQPPKYYTCSYEPALDLEYVDL